MPRGDSKRGSLQPWPEARVPGFDLSVEREDEAVPRRLQYQDEPTCVAALQHLH